VTGAPVCGCITCADAAIPMRIVRVDRGRDLALCESGDGQRQTVETALIPAPAPGDLVLVHAGAAIATLECSAGAA
jgi:hydrogenase assembly chaperone HypC/HupF